MLVGLDIKLYILVGHCWFVCHHPVLGKLLNERDNVCARLLRYILGVPAHSRERLIHRVLSVKEFPQVDAGGVQAKTTTGVGVKENSPVVKLLAEHDVRVSYGFFTVFQGVILPSLRCAMRVPGKRGYFVAIFMRCG